jgi:sec-independent protein translocase protein TatA
VLYLGHRLVSLFGCIWRTLAHRKGSLKGRFIMGELSPIHWLIVIFIIVILFGGKRIPEVMRGMGEGVRNFKEGMRGDTPVATPPSASTQAAPPAETTTVVVTPEKK